MNKQVLLEKEWFQQIMDSEGGLNRNEPESVGGISYAGITQKAYDEWLQKSNYAGGPVSVEELAGNAIGTEWEKRSPLVIPDEYNVCVNVICNFYTDYFKLARLEVVPNCLKYIHADFFVNSKFNANKILQRMVGFTGDDVDGILGPESRERITKMAEQIDETNDDDFIMLYHDAKLEHYESIKEVNPDLYEKNIKGWRKRATHILAELQSYFQDDEPTVSAIHQDDEISLFDDPEAEPDEPYQTPVDHDKLKSDIIGEVSRELAQMLPEMIEEALKGRVTKSIMGRNTIAP